MVIAGSLLVLPLLALSVGAAQNEIYGVNVVPGEGIVRIEISKAGDVTFNAFMMNEPDRLVVNCVGAVYNVPWQEKAVQSSLVNKVRTSQFQVDPLVISRVVVDLASPVEYRMYAEGSKEIIEITARGAAAPSAEAVETVRLLEPVGAGAPSAPKPAPQPPLVQAEMGPMLPYLPAVAPSPEPAAPAQAPKAAETPQPAPAPVAAPLAPSAPAAPVPAAAPVVESPSAWLADKSAEAPSNLTLTEEDNPYSAFAEYEKAKSPSWNETYARGNPPAGGGAPMGSNRITLDAQGADLKTVLRTISDYSGKNIIYGPDVKGEVYVHIKNVPWEEALDILLRAHGYGYREEYGMIRVSELSRLMKEELEIQTAERKKDELLPLRTRIIFVNNSKAEELKNALQNIVSQRGKIDVDKGSNSLIVNDTEPVIDKIAEMVKTLDVKTYQVDINAKLVEIDVEATRELGINWGLLNLQSASIGGAASVDVGSGIPSSDGTIKFGSVRSWGEITGIIEMLEKSNKANIISNPRITTMDNREASIIVGKEIPLIVADEAGNPITQLTKIGIILRVTPHVNADRTITLDLHPEVSELQSEATAQGGVIISMNEADTRVNVKNGETAVIGGLIKNVRSTYRRGVPVLKDIPFLGALFSSSSVAERKQELVVFVTPTIVE
jgi:type II secretory pathway component GspD/PulD (secretin)